MTRELKEVLKLKKYFIGTRERGSLLYFFPIAYAKTRRKIFDDAIRAVREDDAKVAEKFRDKYESNESFVNGIITSLCNDIAAAIRRRK